jgi:hypothetical protein
LRSFLYQSIVAVLCIIIVVLKKGAKVELFSTLRYFIIHFVCTCWIPTIFWEWLLIAVAVTCGTDPYPNVEVSNRILFVDLHNRWFAVIIAVFDRLLKRDLSHSFFTMSWNESKTVRENAAPSKIDQRVQQLQQFHSCFDSTPIPQTSVESGNKWLIT